METVWAAGRAIACVRFGAPAYCVLQPGDPARAEKEAALIAADVPEIPFLLAVYPVAAWHTDLSPWDAPPVFDGPAFGHGAADTLGFLTEAALPALRAAGMTDERTRYATAGYSLGGLFALWALAGSDAFCGAAAASPSVWFPGWTDWSVRHRPPQGSVVCLSLGDREERTRDPAARCVGEAIRTEYVRLQAEGTPSRLDWERGGHFSEPDARTARCIARMLRLLTEKEQHP